MWKWWSAGWGGGEGGARFLIKLRSGEKWVQVLEAGWSWGCLRVIVPQFSCWIPVDMNSCAEHEEDIENSTINMVKWTLSLREGRSMPEEILEPCKGLDILDNSEFWLLPKCSENKLHMDTVLSQFLWDVSKESYKQILVTFNGSHVTMSCRLSWKKTILEENHFKSYSLVLLYHLPLAIQSFLGSFLFGPDSGNSCCWGYHVKAWELHGHCGPEGHQGNAMKCFSGPSWQSTFLEVTSQCWTTDQQQDHSSLARNLQNTSDSNHFSPPRWLTSCSKQHSYLSDCPLSLLTSLCVCVCVHPYAMSSESVPNIASQSGSLKIHFRTEDDCGL